MRSVLVAKLALLITVSFSTSGIQPVLAAPATAPNIEIVLSVDSDGTAPWTGNDALVTHTNCTTGTASDHPLSHTPGDDGNGTTCPEDANGIVRTYDLITYRVDWNVNEVSATEVTVSATLPASVPEAIWARLPAGCNPGTPTAPLSEITNNGQTLTCVLGDFHEGHAGTIFPQAKINGTRADIDGDVVDVLFDIVSNETSPTTSETVYTTISAVPRQDWVKGLPIEYRDILDKDGTPGRVFVYPIFLQPGGGSSRGFAPSASTAPLQFFDHLYHYTHDVAAPLDATLITAANVGSFTGSFGPNGNRYCGGYDGDGTEELRDPSDNTYSQFAMPYGVPGLGSALDTTAGALAGTETITCATVATAPYAIAQVDVSGQDMTSAPDKTANGKGNALGIVIAAQVAYWVPDSELFPTTPLIGQIHNAISGDVTLIGSPPTPVEPASVANGIVLPGTQTGLETRLDNNMSVFQVDQLEGGGGGRTFRHFVIFDPGTYQEAHVDDPNTGMPLANIDTRLLQNGGLGNYEFSPVGDPQSLWKWTGDVSRSQDMTITYGLTTSQKDIAFTDAHYEEIHGCVRLDTTFMDVVDFPATFPIAKIDSYYENEPIIHGAAVGTPSHGLVHVLYGDHAVWPQRAPNTMEMVRLNPAFQPDFVVEVAKALNPTTNAYQRGELKCDSGDAVGGIWTPIDATTNLASFDTDGDGRYEGIDLIRIRTLEPVPWAPPFDAIRDIDRELVTNGDYGSSIRMYIQTKVKSTVPEAPDGSLLYVHASRAAGPYDGVTPPPTTDCLRGGGATFDTFNDTTTGWCNLATEQTPPDNDPIEVWTTASPQAAHRDTVEVVAPRLSVKKTNVDGLTDIVTNGEFVTFDIKVSVTGAPVVDDQLGDITLNDTLSPNYQFISMTQPADGTCVYDASATEIECDFGQKIAPWNDSFSVTVRVFGASASQALPNTVTGDAIRTADGSTVDQVSSTAFSYMPKAYYKLHVHKDVPDLIGPCLHDPGLAHYGANSGDCSYTDRNGNLEYSILVENLSNDPIGTVRVIDVLPHRDDEDEAQTVFLGTPTGPAGTLGDGRQPESDYSGTRELVSVTSAIGGTVYYTSQDADLVNRDPDDPSNATGFPNGSTVWCTALSGGTCPGSMAEVSAFYVDIGTMQIGDSDTIDIVMSTDGNVHDDIYTNTSGARSGDIKVPARSNDVSIMIEEYDLAIVKTLAASQSAGVGLNDTVDYVITIKNQGDVDSQEYTVTDMIPAGMELVSASPADDAASAAGATGLLTWTFDQAADNLVPGDTQVINLTLKMIDDKLGPYRNWVEITEDSGNDHDSEPGDNLGNDSGSGDGGFGGDLADNHNDVNEDEPKDDEDDSDYEDVFITDYDLALIKTLVQTVPTPATTNSQVTYMITVMNQGNVPSGTYTVADTIPAGMSFVSASAGGVHAGGIVTWVVPATAEIPAGGVATFSVTTQIDDVTQQPFRNNADIVADSGDDDDSTPGDGSGALDTFDDQDVSNDNDPGDQDDSDFVTLGALIEYDLALIKSETSVSPSPAAVGSQVTYTITVMNQGNVPSGSYTVDDLIPPGMGFVSASPAQTLDPGVGSDGTVRWVVPAGSELAAGAMATFTVVTEILDAALAPYKNIAEITADSGDDEDSDPVDGSGARDTFDDNDVTNDKDPNDEDDSDFSELSLDPKYDLALIKERNSIVPTPAATGSQVTYTITVMNQGDLPSGTFTVTDTLPTGLTYVSSNPVATANPGTGLSGAVTWVVPATGELAVGAQTTFEIVAEIAAGAVSPLRNAAEITDDSGDDDDSDPTDGSGGTDTFDDGDVTNDEDPGDEDDSDFDELVLDGVYDLALIKELQNISPSPAAVGSLITYQITVQNQGGQPSGTFTVDDVLPAGMVFASAQPAATTDPGVGNNGTVQWVVPASSELQPGDQMVFTLIATIDDAAGSPYHNIADITADSGDDDDSIPGDGSGGTDTFDDHDVTNDEDPGDQDDSDFADVEIGDEYDLALIKEETAVSPAPADHGSQVTYTITVMNQGTMTSGAFQVTDIIPAGMTFVSATSSIPGAVVTDPGVGNFGNVVFDVPLADELSPTDQETFTVIVEIADVLSGPFRNVAAITEDSGPDTDSDPNDGSGGTDTFDDGDVTNDNDPEDSDDSDFAETPVTPVYDLSLIKERTTVDPSPADLGSQVTYTITVMNQGNVPSEVYQVTDTIPSGMAYVSSSASPAGTMITAPAVGASGTVVFDVPIVSGLDVGEQATFEVILEITDVPLTPIRNEADITDDSGDDVDSDPTDGSGSTDTLDDTDVTVDVGPSDQDDSDFDELVVPVRYDLALIKQMKAGSPIDLNAGGQNTFEIVVKNQGNVDSGAFSVTDMIPAGMSYVSSVPAADAPATAGATGLITWSIPATGELAPDAMMSIDLVLQVDDPTQATFRNWAEIETDSAGDYSTTDVDSQPGDNDGNDSAPGDGGNGVDPIINHNDIDHDDPTYDDATEDEDDSDYEDLEVRYDLALVKTLAPGQTPWVDVGSVVDYHVVVKNQGNVPSLGFEVIDTLPVGMSWVGSSGPGFACVHDGAVTGGLATCTYTPPTVADLAPGATVTLLVTLQVDDLTNATFTNWAEISDDGASDYGVTDADSQPGDHGASDTGAGAGAPGTDPSIDHDDIDHNDSAYDDATEDEDDSDPATINAASSTPVTLKSFLATPIGDQVNVYFSTSTEEANIGFHVYGRKGAGSRWKRLNAQMILATDSGNNGGVYNLVVDGAGATQFALADIDTFGKETPHGPFELDRIYGQNPNDPGETVTEDADDLEIESDVDEVSAAASNVAHIGVTKAGVQRVTVKALRNAGVNLIGTPVADVAMTWNDQPLPIWIGNGGVAKVEGTLSKTDVIEFVATVENTMYRNYAVYRLFADRAQARRVLDTSAEATGLVASERGLRHVEWAPNVLYGRTSPIEDAWYAKRLTALHGSVEHTATVKTPRADNASATNATVRVTVWGASSDENVEADHHVKVYINGEEVADARFDGLEAQVIEASVAAGTIVEKNSVRVEVINDGGAGVSAVALESIEITYPADISMQYGRVTFVGNAEAFMTAGQGDSAVTVWRSNDQGLTRAVSADGVFSGAAGEAKYYLTTDQGVRSPQIKPARAMGDLVSGPAEYLIISHSKFIGGDLQRLADARLSDGLSVKTVDVSWIYEANSSGNVSAGAIQDYIAWAHDNLGTRYVLLVGGDTYDYKGYLGESKAKSMIPTLYGPSALGVNHAPVDPMYGDVDGDGVPEVAIGRFPVQKKRELSDIVNKTLTYPQIDYGHRATFVTDDVDDGSQRSFTRDGRRMADLMPEGWQSKVISLDELETTVARNQITGRVRRGSALTTYIGHSDQSVWSFNRVLRRSDVRKLDNIGKPTVVTQFGCWNTYYVDPKRKSLAHDWLLKGENGAAAVMGASTITDATAEQLLADAMYEYLTRGGLTFGEAMVKAKQDLAGEYPMERVEDILSGYLLLGDPAMRLPAIQTGN